MAGFRPRLSRSSSHSSESYLDVQQREARVAQSGTLKAAHDSRRERQRAKKQGAPTAPETTSKGSARPADPAEEPKGPKTRGSVQPNLPTRLQAKERGNVQLNLQIRLKARAKRATLRKARRATSSKASPRRATRRAPPRRARPETSTTARKGQKWGG